VDWVTAFLRAPNLDPNFLDRHGNGALHYAAAFGYKNITRLLLDDDRFNINLMNSKFFPAVEIARRFKRFPIVKMFIEKYKQIGKSVPFLYTDVEYFDWVNVPAMLPETNGDDFSKKSIQKTLQDMGPEFQWENTFSKITSDLYLGGIKPSRDQLVLSRLKITHILDMTKNLGTFPPFNKIKYLNIPIYDDTRAPLKAELPRAIEFIEKAHRERGTIMVHCAAGISRSSSVVIAHLMVTRNWTYDVAFSFVSKYRPIIRPNAGFVEQLQEFAVSEEFKELQKKFGK
jgi:protein-tyrosine phosphatase